MAKVADLHAPQGPSKTSEIENPLLAAAIKTPAFKDYIVAGWRRFSSGLWRISEGDISAAYCADKFPYLKTFVECGQIYTNLGIAHLGDSVEAICYPLLPLGLIEVPKKPYSKEGETGWFKGKQWLLGPKVIFVSEDPPVSDWQKILRAQYALGGYFASQPNYSEFLSSLDDQKMSENETVAIASEKAGEFVRLSKTGMLTHIDSKPNANTRESKQLSLL